MPRTAPLPTTEITVAEVAEMLSVDRKTVLRWIASGQLTPTRKLPGRTGSYLLSAAAVERLADERSVS